ncbi:ATP-grasp domain-containing protein [Flavobacterium hercynium]|uniref:Grasp-with-spasm system ATP-grasp peptide maturase n=1 Tax=Flavobacterium hercynium TaxID=387094 RepID=A0A226GNC0_9FLAO|nr:hypothetical protein [Flavobacterium hercynium]OXA82971.1 hypothetical protein B0A66_22665 [Flavobacterium hercynium]SMP10573.1 ATP-GRASP peptide maturase, grasp-with-spasm system [Flavobacterium hercynium]
MILIINGQYDESTEDICRWLLYLKKEFVRIDNESVFTKINFDFNKDIYEIEIDNHTQLNLNSIKSVFYKSGSFNYKIKKESRINKFIKEFNFEEWKVLENFLRFKLENDSINMIGNLLINDINKLEVLTLAKRVGLKIPETFIISSKDELLSLLNLDMRLITKSIGNMKPIYIEERLFLNYTREITKDEVNSESFMPSLIQFKIEKKYEIRTFFIKNKFWSIAIFSQESTESTIDNRIVNSNHYNTFKLPKKLENKIKELAFKLKLNSGSVDWILSSSGIFYFLEINPLGLFRNISIYGEYNIEKEIAKML